MTPEKWLNTVNDIKDKFPVTNTGEVSIEDEGGTDIEYIEFDGPIGKMRLEFVVRPVIVDKKANFSNRIGSETQVTYIYSTEEKRYKMIVYKWNEYEDDWEEIEAGMFED